MRDILKFPVTLLDRNPESRGMCIHKHGEGVKLFANRMYVKNLSISLGKKSSLRNPHEFEKIYNALMSSFNLITQYKNKPVIKDLFKALRARQISSLSILFLKNHECLLDQYDGGIRIDTGILELFHAPGDSGIDLLYAAGLVAALYWQGGESEEEGIYKTLLFYEQISGDHRRALNHVLNNPAIDVDNIFLRSLNESIGKSEEEKRRLIARIRARTRIETPYNNHEVVKALKEETDLGGLRTRVYNIISNTYRESVDTQSAERISDYCLEKGMRLVAGRFSRAFYLDAMLMAGAKTFCGTHLNSAVTHLSNKISGNLLDFTYPALKNKNYTFEVLGGELQALINLIDKPKVSKAEVEGIVNRFQSSLRDLESQINGEIDSISHIYALKISDERMKKVESNTWKLLSRERDLLRRMVDDLTYCLSMIEDSIHRAPVDEPVFIVFLQRLFELDAVNLGTVNELVDPFFGEDEEIQRLIREGGHNVYITPNLKAWLRKCTDWIEALPAYAHYEIVPNNKGGYQVFAFVQRFILELMYRLQAENWALNIDDVMHGEHVSIARDLLVQKLETGINSKSNINQEETIRQIIREKGLYNETAGLAALVTLTYENLCDDVARTRNDLDCSRKDALYEVILTNKSKKNLVRSFIDSKVRSDFNAPIDNIIRRSPERDYLEEIRKNLVSMAGKRKREIPNIHVLTTLGPGETEINVQNWLEESMGLFNVCRKFHLEKKVKNKMDEYRERFVILGRKIIAEMHLEGDLLSIMEEDGLDDKAPAIMKIIASYPEVADEVAKLALLIEFENKNGKPNYGKDPPILKDYIKNNPDLVSRSILKVVENNNLSQKIGKYSKEHEIDPDAAARAVIESNIDYENELKGSIRLEARDSLIKKYGLINDVKDYLKKYQTLAVITARREVIMKEGLSQKLSHALYRYEASGPYKKFNILYTPSRVDLGANEVRSVRDIPKWVGGLDQDASNAGKSLYDLYNTAGAKAVNSSRWAEFLKVGENFFSRGGVYYLSLAAGINIDTLKMGDFEFFSNQWNMRGDRMVLPTGETYGGFCVPKEFSLLYAVITSAIRKETSQEILKGFGIPLEIQEDLLNHFRKMLRLQVEYPDPMEWEKKALQLLPSKCRKYIRLSQLALTMEKLGIISRDNEDKIHDKFRFANWVNKKAQGLEEINRTGPFRKVVLIRELIDEARRRNPQIAEDNKIIGMMTASYKEGERVDGREIPVSDVRFSAGARKLEIYSGTAEQHLLKDIDPEGRDIIKDLLKGFVSPADIRMVGACAGSDVLNHVPNSGLEDIKEQVNIALLDAGLDQNVIDANCSVHGGDLSLWAGIKELPAKTRESLISKIGPQIHLLVLDKRGVYRKYEQAVHGVDFIDLGIPDPELLDLIDDLPKLLLLMKAGRPQSALVLADGTSGGRGRCCSFRHASSKAKVKEWFALDDNAVYGCLGLGSDTIKEWRQEMNMERNLAAQLKRHLVNGKYSEAHDVYRRIQDRIERYRIAEEAVEDEIKARNLNVWNKKYRYVSDTLGKIKKGLPLHKLDFGAWIILGGFYIVNGKFGKKELVRERIEFEKAVLNIPESYRNGYDWIPGNSKKDVDFIVDNFVRPKYIPPIETDFEEISTGIGGSLKATEEKAARLGNLDERRKQAKLATALRKRKIGFIKASSEIEKQIIKPAFEELYKTAINILGNPKSEIDQETFGEFIAHTKNAFLNLIDDLPGGEDNIKGKFLNDVSDYFSWRQMDNEQSINYQTISHDLARLAEYVNKDKHLLDKVASLSELLDISLLLEKTGGVDDGEELIIHIARFFDTTINSHIFDYIPYHYYKERGFGYECYSRRDKFDLAVRHHRWLYSHIRWLMGAKSLFKNFGNEYLEGWLGDADRDILGIGLELDDKNERFWFCYARLRDAAVLLHDGYPAPKVLNNLDPGIIKSDERANVLFVYPHGNTTIPVALEQGVKLAGDDINLFLSPCPYVVDYKGRSFKEVIVKDTFMFISESEYLDALLDSGVDKTEAVKKARESELMGKGKGVLIAARFKAPVTAHALFFHFTHPLRPYIGKAKVPLIQPILWEAATHLKCLLPDMLKGSGVRTADQFNWIRSYSQKHSPQECKSKIHERLLEFSQKHSTVIVKPEKESGGRMARILQIKKNNRLLDENIREISDDIYDISLVDNAVIQEVLPSHVRQIYTKDFLKDLVDRFARLGVPVLLDRTPQTPLYSYFRLVLVLGERNYEITHRMTVVSTRGIANVGQGGILYEYTDDIIHQKYRSDLKREMEKTAINSIMSQRKYIKIHWREILNEYLSIHPEYAGNTPMKLGSDLTGFLDSDIPYEMGDYMPVMLVDEKDRLVKIFDEDKEEIVDLFDDKGNILKVGIFDHNGKPVERKDKSGKALSIPMFDNKGKRIHRYLENGKEIPLLKVFKIESNPGAGLWKPHDKQLPPERKGEGVYKLFRCFGERAKIYRKKLMDLKSLE